MKLKIYSLAFILVAKFANAQSPQATNYQSVLRDVSGNILANTNVCVQSTITDALGTTIYYQETFSVLTNQFGLFTLGLGAGTPVTGTFSTINWGTITPYLKVEIKINCAGGYITMGSSPLLSVPYALYAASGGTSYSGGTGINITGATITNTAPDQTVTLTGAGATTITGTYPNFTVTSTDNVGVTGSGTVNYLSKFTGASAIGNSQVFDNATSIGIGTVTPTATNKLQVVNPSSSTNQHAVHGISGAAASGSITINSGLYGESSTGIGVSGVGQANDGVFGYSLSGTAAGVEGYNSAAGGAGVMGEGDPAGSFGGYFDGGSAGYGLAVANGLSGFGTVTPGAMVHVSGSRDLSVTLGGVSFTHQALIAQTSATATNNLAVAAIGFCPNSTFENHGLHAFARGPGGASYNVGIFSSGTSATVSTGNSYGVYGSASNGATNYGFYGTATGGTAYAGYFAGNVTVTGTLAKGAGSFKIDHPLDPENKYLYHSFVESPDMMNIYNGNVITDADGNAVVTMPDYFEVLNKDFRYQLTVIGTFAQAIISEKITGNRFSIKTDRPNVEVSWMVTGVRQDKFANAHRIIPEVEKEAAFKGHYLHAAEWNMPAEKSIDYLTQPKSVREKSSN